MPRPPTWGPRRASVRVSHIAGAAGAEYGEAMKRHDALHPLSHDHQNALARALRLRRVRDADEAARRTERDSFVEFAATRLEPHFAEEEALLARAVTLVPEQDDLAAAHDRMLADHARMRASFETLRTTTGTPSGEELHAIGEQLTEHVRFEERELFELLQRSFQGERLAELVDA